MTLKTAEILTNLASTYQQKVGEEQSLVVNLALASGGESPEVYHVLVAPGRLVALYAGPARDARFTLKMSPETLRRIYERELTALTAAGRARMSDPAPLDIELPAGTGFTQEVQAEIYAFLQHFFNPTWPEVIPLGEEHARVVHDAHAIPLFYHPGSRSAWYQVNPGEHVNEPGDKNTFPQAFIFIKGEGRATIGDTTLDVRAGEAVYVPPGADHIIRNESDGPLEMIFLAWGAGA
jgi:mannose-6-phosphate isomerase-like protein (cupin superfamily)